MNRAVEEEKLDLEELAEDLADLADKGDTYTSLGRKELQDVGDVGEMSAPKEGEGTKEGEEEKPDIPEEVSAEDLLNEFYPEEDSRAVFTDECSLASDLHAILMGEPIPSLGEEVEDAYGRFGIISWTSWTSGFKRLFSGKSDGDGDAYERYLSRQRRKRDRRERERDRGKNLLEVEYENVYAKGGAGSCF